MKKIFVIVVLTVISFSISNYGLSSENNWIVVSSGDEDTTYFDIQFIGKKGWIVGWIWDVGGVILHTTDGGNSWTEHIYNGNANYGFRAVHFQNENEGWIVSGGQFDFFKGTNKEPYIFHTTDGGDTWTPIHQRILDDPFKGFLHWLREPSSLMLSDVYFVSPSEGWLIGGPDALIGTSKHFLFHSSDAGKTWVGRHFSEILSEVYFITSEEGWLVTESSCFHTVDNGKTWEPATLDKQFPSLVSIQFISQEGWLIESHGNIYYTTDSGGTWEVLSIVDKLKPRETICDGFFVSSKEGWVVSKRGKVLHTTDGGKDWQMLDDADLVADLGIWLRNVEYVPFTGEIWALGRGSRFEPYILRHPAVLTSVNPIGKISATWGKIKTRY